MNGILHSTEYINVKKKITFNKINKSMSVFVIFSDKKQTQFIIISIPWIIFSFHIKSKTLNEFENLKQKTNG